jgi:hypothetical protein
VRKDHHGHGRQEWSDIGDEARKASSMYLCSVQGCGEVVIVLSRDVEEEERISRVCYAAHQERSETMRRDDAA